MNIISNYEQRKFWILVIIVAISGFSQGMLMPLISVIFETDGVSSFLNGLNATGLYIGTLLISPFIEQPLRKYGYKPIILIGGGLVFVSLFFPILAISDILVYIAYACWDWGSCTAFFHTNMDYI